MADAVEIPQTLLQKLLFYTTATFVLLGTFSLFAFLFLVPFVIDPAFTTIFMQFDTRPATCVTADVRRLFGASNCTWASCREGCTKDLYECTQIRVNYKVAVSEDGAGVPMAEVEAKTEGPERSRAPRAIRDYDYEPYEPAVEPREAEAEAAAYPDAPAPTGLQGNDSEWYFTGAKFFPNVKGCGYPPFLNCSIFYAKYITVGTNYSCYYSRVDPGLVISDLDMWQNTLNLVYAMAIPIPSFIVSVIYLTFAYFKIYAEDEEAEQAPLQGDAEAMAEAETDEEGGVVGGAGAAPLLGTPGSDTFREDLARTAYHNNKDDRSPAISNSASIPGNLSKTMTTSISTPPGPIAAV